MVNAPLHLVVDCAPLSWKIPLLSEAKMLCDTGIVDEDHMGFRILSPSSECLNRAHLRHMMSMESFLLLTVMTTVNAVEKRTNSLTLKIFIPLSGRKHAWLSARKVQWTPMQVFKQGDQLLRYQRDYGLSLLVVVRVVTLREHRTYQFNFLREESFILGLRAQSSIHKT